VLNVIGLIFYEQRPIANTLNTNQVYTSSGNILTSFYFLVTKLPVQLPQNDNY